MTHAQGYELYLSDRSATGYQGVKEKQWGFEAYYAGKYLGLTRAAVDAAVLYAKAKEAAEAVEEEEEEGDEGEEAEEEEEEEEEEESGEEGNAGSLPPFFIFSTVASAASRASAVTSDERRVAHSTATRRTRVSTSRPLAHRGAATNREVHGKKASAPRPSGNARRF